MDFPFQDGYFQDCCFTQVLSGVSAFVFEFKVMGRETSVGCVDEPGIWWPMQCQGESICGTTGSVNFVFFFNNLFEAC